MEHLRKFPFLLGSLCVVSENFFCPYEVCVCVCADRDAEGSVVLETGTLYGKSCEKFLLSVQCGPWLLSGGHHPSVVGVSSQVPFKDSMVAS